MIAHDKRNRCILKFALSNSYKVFLKRYNKDLIEINYQYDLVIENCTIFL